MKTLKLDQQKSITKDIGGKAKNLSVLDSLNLPVPKWTVISQEVLTNQLLTDLDLQVIKEQINLATVSTNTMNQLANFFGPNYKEKKYAVRSSAIDEDGLSQSFAGQFDSYLNVSFEDLASKIKQVWKSSVSDRVLEYRKENELSIELGIAVIIQEMIPADVAGVAFGIDPVNHKKNCHVISAVYGLGEGLVSGELDADNYFLQEGKLESQIQNKTHQLVEDVENGGLHKVTLDKQMQNQSCLTEDQVNEISSVLTTLEAHFNHPQDIEFAYHQGQLYLLQTRPVTNIKTGEYILWDNSNIIESYPGVTTPLTFSFIIKMYEMVYRQLSGLLGVSEKMMDDNKEVFENTLGLVRGRVYYNLLNWYKMLAMVPGYSINASFMENMMGVKESFELEEDYKMTKGMAWFKIVLMVFKMIGLQIKLPNIRRKFNLFINDKIETYSNLPLEEKTDEELIQLYHKYEASVLLEWKAPMINDFFAMIWFGMLQKKTHEYFPKEGNLHNDLLCGSQDIISTQPIHRTIQIADQIRKDASANDLFCKNDPMKIWNTIQKDEFTEIRDKIESYLNEFGERCIGELKLETISYRQNPNTYIKVLQSYVKNNITKNKGAKNIENELRENAENKVNVFFKGKLLKKWWYNFILKQTRIHVSNRENLRYERTRAFGIVRRIFSALGQKWNQQNKIENARDIFFLELDEILNSTDDMTKKIRERKATFARYEEEQNPEERFYTYGYDFSDQYIYSKEKLEKIEGDLTGIGCCPGLVEAEVCVIKDPSEIDSLDGAILVTSSTDPGWVTLFPSASGIIVERGSLLSHSAIVSREMGIPCIVGVKGLLRTLKTGDKVLMDGSNGIVKILDQ